jgi:hypothetical protein
MRFVLVSKLSLVLPLIFHLSSSSGTETQYSVHGPDKSISAYFWISHDRNACYRAKFFDTVILEQSELGIINWR